ncbi:MAG: carboxypeptidase-like regulatory domain-containing protein, partial [Paludibacteraceae bacterium]|nr:carboxypeptidase-like regulatory domain-containing protein [Paludibacteraceae bacterium]
MKRLVLISLWLFLSLHLLAQETIVVGEVYDANTGEPLSNVHVYLQGTQLGTTTNAEGLFLLREDLDRSRTMVVSAVGYHTERFKIEPHTQSGIDIALREKVGSLQEVFIVPGDNPALALMDKVRARRAANKRAVATSQAGKTALYVSDIQSKHLKRALWKSLQSGMIQQEDSSYLIPLYWRQQVADSVREEATLLTLTDYQLLLGQIPTAFDFYDNSLPFLSTSLLSPLAASGNTYYNYYLADSVQVGDEKHYLLHFKTKNPFYATFNGEMTIDSATCALRKIDVQMPVQTSINYLKELTIHQTFAPNNQLLSEQMSLLMDFAIKTPSLSDSVHIFPTLLLNRDNRFLTDMTSTVATLDTTEAMEDVILPALDSLNNTPLFKTAKFLAYVLNTGYIPTNKYVEVGKIHHLIKYNQQEGLRVGIPLRTTEALWKHVSLEAMVAYGTGDRAFKGFGQVNIALPSERRHTVQLKYRDLYVYSEVDDFEEYRRENKIFSPQVNLITDIFRGARFNSKHFYNTMTRRQEGRVQFADDWNKYLETKAYIKVGQTGYGEATRNYHSQPTMFYSTVGASARVSFNERKVD